MTTAVVHAQALDFATSATLVPTPAQPAPFQEVSLEMKSALIDLDRADIEWSVDGTPAANGVGLTRVKIHAGELGSTRTITASATGLDGASIRGMIAIKPVMVDIAWEAESYAPANYRGRRFPSSGTYIRAEATAYFQREDGTIIPKGDLIYTWKRNGAILGTVSGAGKYAIRIPTPTFLGESMLTVEVSSRDGSFSGNALVRIPAVEPYVVLYQDDPLRGILYSNAVYKRASFSEDEITFAAIPFFSSVTKLTDPNLTFSWKINGKGAPTDPKDPSRLTISRGSRDTQARLGVQVAHKTTLFQEGEGSWLIEFGSASNGTTNGNPFIAPNAQSL